MATWLEAALEAAWQALTVFLVTLFGEPLAELLSKKRREDARWRAIPGDDIAPLLADLQPTSRKAYTRALQQFDVWVRQQKLVLDSPMDVDEALYIYMGTVTRSCGETTLSALIKVYPLLRQKLDWAHARKQTIAGKNPPVHHLPMVWAIVVNLAWALATTGYPRRAALFLLGWRLGLRPAELVALTSDDVYSRWRNGMGPFPAFLRLGAKRGTKAGHPEIVRAHTWDEVTNWLLDNFKATTPPGTRLSDICSYAQLSLVLRAVLIYCGYVTPYTPHCMRAGWATWRFVNGQPRGALMSDGRWRSETSMMVYLDATAAADSLADSVMEQRLHWITQLEGTICQWLRW